MRFINALLSLFRGSREDALDMHTERRQMMCRIWEAAH